MLTSPRRNRKATVSGNEQGFASIVIALLLIVVLALLTVGFAQLARREQQNALDKQLANQAYYAAESGVNDAYRAIKDPALAPSLLNSPTTCYGRNSRIPGTTNNIVDATSGTQYTCVLVNQKPDTLVKDLPADSQWTTAFTLPSTPVGMTMSWQSKDGKTPSNDIQHRFTPQGAAWNHPAVLQFSVTPLSGLDRNSLLSNMYTVYMYPSTDSGAAVYSNAPGDQGRVVAGGCTAAGSCSVTIAGGFPAGVTSYLIHVLSYYDDSHILFDAHDISGARLQFSGSQAVIDSTGQDKNVLKRIQVHVPIFPTSDNLPDYAIQAQNVCKRFTTYPTGGTSQNSVAYPTGLPGGFDASTPCSLN